MESITGIKLISAATVFGTAAVIFTTVPFILVLLRGVVRARDRSTGGGNFLGVVLLAFVIHAVCTICFMGTMMVLDELNMDLSGKSEKYYTDKLFKIFWAKDAMTALGIAEVTDKTSNEAKGVATTLTTVTTAANLFYLAIPLIVILSSCAYGIGLATKDTYRQDYLTVIIYAGVSMAAAMTLYIAWAYIASEGLFLPNNDNLFDKISKTWIDMVWKTL